MSFVLWLLIAVTNIYNYHGNTLNAFSPVLSVILGYGAVVISIVSLLMIIQNRDYYTLPFAKNGNFTILRDLLGSRYKKTVNLNIVNKNKSNNIEFLDVSDEEKLLIFNEIKINSEIVSDINMKELLKSKLFIFVMIALFIGASLQ